jgi:hypothetical protein
MTSFGTNSLIIMILKKGKAGVLMAALCCEHCMSAAIYYEWQTNVAPCRPV